MVKAIEIIDLQELKQVHAHEFEANAQMLPENHIVVQMDDVHDVLGVVVLQELKDLKLNSSLIVVFLFVLDDFHADFFARFVIQAFERGAEGALAQELLDFVAVADVVIVNYVVVALFVVVAEVVFMLLATVDLLVTSMA